MSAADQPHPWADHGVLFQRLMAERVSLLGDIAEFGVYNGGSTIQLAAFGRRVWAFDTFEGMPVEECVPTLDQDKPGSFVPTVDLGLVFGVLPNVAPLRGRFARTIAVVPPWVRFALVYMDCDLWRSYRTVLDWLPRHLATGAAVVMDDYDACAGARLAVDDWLAHWKLSIDAERVVVWRG